LKIGAARPICFKIAVFFATSLETIMLQRFAAAIFLGAISFAAMAQTPARHAAAEKAWIEKSNEYTNLLLKVQLEHSPEAGSSQGLAKFDDLISNPSREDELAERRELEAALTKIKAAQPSVTDKNVKEDIEILQKAFNLQFRRQDFELAREVPFITRAREFSAVCACFSMTRSPRNGVPPRWCGCANTPASSRATSLSPIG
jgi:uncharacterized protein YchJ